MFIPNWLILVNHSFILMVAVLNLFVDRSFTFRPTYHAYCTERVIPHLQLSRVQLLSIIFAVLNWNWSVKCRFFSVVCKVVSV